MKKLQVSIILKKQQKTNTLFHSKMNCDIKYYIYEYLNKEFGDYKVVGFIKHQYRGWLFQLKCKICGHYYITDFKSLKINKFNHSYKNCEKDYLNLYKNKIIGDFKCLFAKRDKNLAIYLYGKCLVCNTLIKLGEKYFKEHFEHNLIIYVQKQSQESSKVKQLKDLIVYKLDVIIKIIQNIKIMEEEV